VSVDAIEAATGYDFFSELPKNVQQTLESKVDKGREQ
jgi:DNA/RNA endonuclease G (NUC1)